MLQQRYLTVQSNEHKALLQSLAKHHTVATCQFLKEEAGRLGFTDFQNAWKQWRCPLINLHFFLDLNYGLTAPWRRSSCSCHVMNQSWWWQSEAGHTGVAVSSQQILGFDTTVCFWSLRSWDEWKKIGNLICNTACCHGPIWIYLCM